MKIEEQVCTLKQAKQIKVLGANQKEALYFWDENDNKLYRSVDGSAVDIGCIAAFTVAELGIMLPDIIEYEGKKCFVTSEKYPTSTCQWICGIHTVWAHDKPVVAKKYCLGITEAESRADLLIYILTNKIIKVEECNQRLSA